MSSVNDFNRMKALNEIAIKAMFSNPEWRENSDYRIWALKISQITSQLAIEEINRYAEIIQNNLERSDKSKLKNNIL